MNNDNAHYNLKLARPIIFMVLGALCVVVGVVIILTTPFALSIVGLIVGSVLCSIGGGAFIVSSIDLIYLVKNKAATLTQYPKILKNTSNSDKEEVIVKKQTEEEKQKEAMKKSLLNFCKERGLTDVHGKMIRGIFSKEKVSFRILKKNKDAGILSNTVMLECLTKPEAEHLLSLFKEVLLDLHTTGSCNMDSYCVYREDEQDQGEYYIEIPKLAVCKMNERYGSKDPQLEVTSVATSFATNVSFDHNKQQDKIDCGSFNTGSKLDPKIIKLMSKEDFLKGKLIFIVKSNEKYNDEKVIVALNDKVSVKLGSRKKNNKLVIKIKITSENKEERKRLESIIEDSLEKIGIKIKSKPNSETIKVNPKQYWDQYCNMCANLIKARKSGSEPLPGA